jgi:hypothetical protein
MIVVLDAISGLLTRIDSEDRIISYSAFLWSFCRNLRNKFFDLKLLVFELPLLVESQSSDFDASVEASAKSNKPIRQWQQMEAYFSAKLLCSKCENLMEADSYGIQLELSNLMTELNKEQNRAAAASLFKCLVKVRRNLLLNFCSSSSN